MRPDIILFLSCYMGYVLSLCGFCVKYLADCRVNQKQFAILLLLAGVSAGFLNSWINAPYILGMMISHILFGGLCYIMFRDDKGKILFVAAILLAVKTLVWNFGCSLLACLALISANAVTGGQITSVGIEADHIISAVSYCLVILALTLLRKKLSGVLHNKIKSWYYIVSIPLVLIVFIVDVVNWGASNGIMVVSNANGAAYWNVYYNQIFSHAAICLLTLLGMCIAAGSVFGMNKIDREQKQKEHYYSRIEFYKMLNEQYLQMEKLRHDMKNHVLSLYGLWEDKEYDKLGNYLGRMLESGNIGAYHEATGNKAMDALLYSKRKQAEREGIRWECDVQMPGVCAIDEFDLCIVFGNIIDNALHACAGMQDTESKFVHVQARRVKQCFLIVVKNATALKEIAEMKKGIGLLNVSETVRKYNGAFHAAAENNIFEISILLPMKQNVHNMEQDI